MLLSPDCKQRYKAEGINHVVCSRHCLREKCGRLVLGAQGYVHTPKSGLFPDRGMGCTAPLSPRQLTPLPCHARWPPRAASWVPACAVAGTAAQEGAAGLQRGDAAACAGGGPGSSVHLPDPCRYSPASLV